MKGLFNRHSISILIVICAANTIQAQITNIVRIPISYDFESRIINNLSKYGSDTAGNISNLQVSKSHMGTFIEEADYGPMWYGDTITVNHYGFLIEWEYDRYDNMVDRSQAKYKSNDWHSKNKLFIPYDCSAYYPMYICRFGGVPPSHGFANRHYKWDTAIENLMAVLKNIEE